MPSLVIGVDLGGTNIKVGLITEEGRVVGRRNVPTGSDGGPKAVAARICGAARECVELSGAQQADLRGVGVGSPGTINLAEGVVEFSPNLPGWRNIPLRALIQDDLALPCVLDNDANVAALAEQWVGAGRGADSLVLLTLGTGIGGGIVLDGRIWHGAGGVAGEIGHMCIEPEGRPCPCGNRGCFERYASATGMVLSLREAVEAGAQTPLTARLESVTARDISQAAVAGDAVAAQVLERTARYLGLGVSNLMHILNARVFAFSGGVTAAGERLMAPLMDEMTKRTLEASRRNVRVCFAELPNDAGIIGAARCFMLA
jgi:glucokinase